MNEKYANQYLIKPAEDGTRADTKLAVEYSDEAIAQFLAQGYVLVGSDDFNKLIGNADRPYSIAMDGTLYETPPYVPSLEETKAQKLQEAGAEFAKRRDAIRWVECTDGRYGFDCGNEDITNFLAAWRAAENGGSTGYKVWFTETTKGLVILTDEDFQTVFDAVRESQLADYAWYETKRTEIEACTTNEEVANVVL